MNHWHQDTFHMYDHSLCQFPEQVNMKYKEFSNKYITKVRNRTEVTRNSYLQYEIIHETYDAQENHSVCVRLVRHSL